MERVAQAEILTITFNLRALLRSHHKWHADVVERLECAIRDDDLSEVKRRFETVDLWGGSGSVADVNFGDKRLDAKKCELVVQLVDALSRQGVESRAAFSWASTFRSWLGKGIFK